MTEKELRKLSRLDLVDLLIEEMEENERIKAELKATKEELGKLKIMTGNYGSLTELAEELNKIFISSQKTASACLENYIRNERKADNKVQDKTEG